MKPSRILCYGCGILGVSTALFTAQAQKITALPKWTPDKALMENLAEAVELEGYAIQPPKGYEMQEGEAPEGIKALGWGGEQRASGVRPSLAMMIASIPKAEAKKYTLEQMTEKLAGGVKRRRTEWQQSKIEKGIINGLTFARIRWTGTETTHQMKMQGFVYATRIGNSLVSFTSQDTALEAKRSLALAEAALFTFKKLP